MTPFNGKRSQRTAAIRQKVRGSHDCNNSFTASIFLTHKLFLRKPLFEMTERVRSRVQAAEMGLSLLDKVKSTDICPSLNIEPLLLSIELW